MNKILNTTTPQRKQQIGINAVVDMMKITIGPRGKNVSLSNGDTVNDGKRIADDVTLKDPTENKGVEKVKNLIRSISSDVGGGRTACGIMYQSLINTGLNLIDRGFNANHIKNGMKMAVEDLNEQLDTLSQPAKGKLKEIATISTESEELGKVIAETIEKVGLDSVVTVEESQSSFGVTSQIEEGLKCNQGYMSPYMVTDADLMEAEYKDIPVFITNKKITSPKDLIPILNTLDSQGKKDLFIIAEDIDEVVLRFCVGLRAQGAFNVLAIKTPGVGDLKKFVLEDLSALTGAIMITDENWEQSLEDKQVIDRATNQSIPTKAIKQGILGKIAKVVSKKDHTIIYSAHDIKAWITTLKTRRELAENKWEKDQYDERIAKLQNGIAVIKVGSSSSDDVKYLKLKIEDGINEAKRALEEGIVVGGNVSLIHAQKNCHNTFTSDDEELGYKIVIEALEGPLRQIVINSGGSPDLVIHEIKNSDSLTSGYNSLDNKVINDMYKEGIVDAVKVVKTVLKYAVTEASLFLSIGGDISNEPKVEINN